MRELAGQDKGLIDALSSGASCVVAIATSLWVVRRLRCRMAVNEARDVPVAPSLMDTAVPGALPSEAPGPPARAD